ncbi:MAG: hypothetical protein J3K34DRAFT_17317 [Monoraphidium minutum]|nr:MAG: hypothetical protein J3K34DRAFT_17317 [Monoraphidium minutum]
MHAPCARTSLCARRRASPPARACALPRPPTGRRPPRAPRAAVPTPPTPGCGACRPGLCAPLTPRPTRGRAQQSTKRGAGASPWAALARRRRAAQWAPARRAPHCGDDPYPHRRQRRGTRMLSTPPAPPLITCWPAAYYLCRRPLPPPPDGARPRGCRRLGLLLVGLLLWPPCFLTLRPSLCFPLHPLGTLMRVSPL